MEDQQSIYKQYADAKAERDTYRPLWQEISRYVGISVDPNHDLTKRQNSDQLDQFVDDPTSAISVNQYGDYMLGIMWGTGDNVFSVVPSDHVLRKVPVDVVNKWYDYVTKRSLYHANHQEAGLNAALKAYSYDQASFGNSGIGGFINPDFKSGVSHNAMIFRNYGIDNTSFELGLNGMPEKVFVDHRWKLNRILKEFCTVGGKFSKAEVGKLPKAMREAYEKQNFNEEFNIVYAVFPREDYDPKLIGRRGKKYRGVWFMNDNQDNGIFREESYSRNPISMCRQIVVRSETYGRASGTMLLSTIKAVNFMVGTVIEILEKQSNPSLGVANNALFGDSVLDTSPNSLTVFNPSVTDGKNPIFPLYDVGDPSGIIKILIPYLNEKITTAFKVDSLLDFNSANDMTATESLQRYAIRGKSLSGMLVQQKVECLHPLVERIITALWELGEFGIDPRINPKGALMAQQSGREDIVIPEAVLECIDQGLPWFDIKFNNELEKLTRTESIEGLLKVIQVVGAIAPMYPNIVEAVDWYKLLDDINENLDPNNQILIGATKFKEKMAQVAQMQQQSMALQAGQVAAQAQNQSAQANKANREAAAA